MSDSDKILQEYYDKLINNRRMHFNNNIVGVASQRLDDEYKAILEEMSHKLKNAKVTEILKDL